MKKNAESAGTEREIDFSDIPEVTPETFRGVVRGKHYTPVPPDKTRITIRIDTDILDWFRAQVDRAGGGSYQATINQALREYITSKAEPLEPLLRRVMREELDRRKKAS